MNYPFIHLASYNALNNGKPTLFLNNPAISIKFFDDGDDLDIKRLTKRKQNAFVEEEYLVDGRHVALRARTELLSLYGIQTGSNEISGIVLVRGDDVLVVTEHLNCHLNAELTATGSVVQSTAPKCRRAVK